MSNPAHRQTVNPAGSSTAAMTGTSGSQTILQTEAGPSGTLRLRASSAEPDTSSSRHVVWAEDVIDNEGMGKKSSKVCCIYHKPHEPGDSDSDSSSSDSGSDSEPDLSRAQKAGGKGKRGRKHNHDHEDSEGDGKGKGKERRPSPNAYERQPKHKGKKNG